MITQDPRMAYWNSSDVAECIGGLGDSIYRKLWLLHIAEPKTEEPVVRKYDWWDKLTEAEQIYINECFQKEYPE